MIDYPSQYEDEPANTSVKESGLGHALSRLEYITSRLRLRGKLVFAFTLMNLISIIFYYLFLSWLKDGLIFTPANQLIIFQIIQFLFALLASYGAGMYEVWRKRGDALFEEVSDEMEWNIRGARLSEGGTIARERPNIEVRATLRTFARASDMPFIPGRLGPAIYIAVNLVLLFVSFLSRV